MNCEVAMKQASEHPLDAAARVVGGRNSLAQRLDISVAAIGNWKKRGATPIEHCVPIERATNGAVTRKDLRPDDWAAIWPELAISAPIHPVPSVERSFSATDAVAQPQQGAAHA